MVHKGILGHRHLAELLSLRSLLLFFRLAFQFLDLYFMSFSSSSIAYFKICRVVFLRVQSHVLSHSWSLTWAKHQHSLVRTLYILNRLPLFLHCSHRQLDLGWPLWSHPGCIETWIIYAPQENLCSWVLEYPPLEDPLDVSPSMSLPPTSSGTWKTAMGPWSQKPHGGGDWEALGIRWCWASLFPCSEWKCCILGGEGKESFPTPRWLPLTSSAGMRFGSQ